MRKSSQSKSVVKAKPRKGTAANESVRGPSSPRRRGASGPNASPVKLTTRDLKAFRSVLLQERERLVTELQRIESRTARRETALLGGEPAQYDDHMAELASEAFDREQDLASHDSLVGMLEEVNVALEKMSRDSYGLCDVCGGDIGLHRLRALPYANLCLHCQSRVES